MYSNLNQQQIIDIAKAVAEILKPTITEIVKTTISEIFKQQSNPPNDSSKINTLWGCTPLNIYSSNLSSQCQIAQTINNAIINSETIKAKSMRAVIEKLPEVNDEGMVRSLVKECGLEDKVNFAGIHRHPPHKDNKSSKPHILKIPFTDTKSRDTFLYSFRKCVKSLPNVPKNITARRDMTQYELNILYNLRKQAYDLNVRENLFKYFVVDLEIRKMSHPKPLKVKNASA